MSDAALNKISRAEAFGAFARIGLLSFGGPAAQIAVTHQVIVEEKAWLTEEEFLHGLNFCMLLPGPEAMQLATYVGWRTGEVSGGLVAGLLFVVPGLAMMLALAAILVAFGDLPTLVGLFYGLKAAVIAVVLQALLMVSGKALKTKAYVAIAVAAFIAISFFHVPFPLVVLSAGLVGLLTHQPARASSHTTSEPDSNVATLRAITVWGAVWGAPLLVLMSLGGFAADAALFFSKAAVVTFGGAYVVLAYVGQQAVDTYGWLSAAEMLKGLGLAETTLGPLVLVLVFVGFLGGTRSLDVAPLLGGLSGGLIAAFFTFAPCFLWIFAAAPHLDRLGRIERLSAALAAVTAAVVGVIANLSVWFSLAVVFDSPDYSKFGAVWLPQLDQASPDWVAVGIGAAASCAMLWFRVGMLKVLAASAVVGLAIHVLT